MRRASVRMSVVLGCVLLLALPGVRAQTADDDKDADLPTAGFDPNHSTPAEANAEAWRILQTAMANKSAQKRVQAIAALGFLGNLKAAQMIEPAFADPDLDVRTAAILAAGQAKLPLLTGKVHAMLDDKEPQVVFAAALTLWKMKDRSGEDVLMAVAAGDRSANPTLVHGTMHTMDEDLHNPGMLARMGAMQGASMLLGPFGIGIGAYEAIHKAGGDSARVTAVEQLKDEKTDPIREVLLGDLGDKDQSVRAAAAKVLAEYRQVDVERALTNLFVDPKGPVRYTAAAAYLKAVGGGGRVVKKK
jgi:HEAT repeat protein